MSCPEALSTLLLNVSVSLPGSADPPAPFDFSISHCVLHAEAHLYNSARPGSLSRMIPTLLAHPGQSATPSGQGPGTLTDQKCGPSAGTVKGAWGTGTSVIMGTLPSFSTGGNWLWAGR
jgi:hypothetical protein